MSIHNPHTALGKQAVLAQGYANWVEEGCFSLGCGLTAVGRAVLPGWGLEVRAVLPGGVLRRVGRAVLPGAPFLPHSLPQAVLLVTRRGRTRIWRSPNISVKEEIKIALTCQLGLI